MGEVGTAARGDAAGQAAGDETAHERDGTGHRPQPLVEQALEDLLRLDGELVDRVLEAVPFDHDAERHPLRPAHHRVEEIEVERAAAAAEHLAADVLVEILGIDEQAVEVERHRVDRGATVGRGHRKNPVFMLASGTPPVR